MSDCTRSLYPLVMATTKSTQTAKAISPWESTKTQYLIRYRPSGVYFAKFKAGGKQFRFSLNTTVLTVAQVRLNEERRKRVAAASKPTTGRLTFGDAVILYRQQFQADQHLKPGTKGYKEETLLALQKTWPGPMEADLGKITEKQCQEWARRYAAEFSATRFNGTLTTLRHVFDVGVKEGARHDNPVMTIKRQRVRAKKLTLSSREEFTKLVQAMESAGEGTRKTAPIWCASSPSLAAGRGRRQRLLGPMWTSSRARSWCAATL
jgi:hypothetical protein